MTDAPDRAEQLRLEAAAWFARMRREDNSAYRVEFEAWLADAGHREAYNRIAGRFTESKLLQESPQTIAALKAARVKRRRAAPVLAALIVAFALGALAMLPQLGRIAAADRPAAAQLTGASDKVLRVRLTDGSVVTLDRDSRVAVAFDAETRRLTLSKGRARFAVAHGTRPFTVRADSTSVTAHGTLFDVALGSGGVEVALIEGSVSVDARGIGPAAPKATRRRLKAGEAVIVTSTIRTRPDFAMASAVDWTHAVIEVRTMALGELLARANRVGAVRLEVDDPALAATHVSGRFQLDDPVRLAATLARLFALEIDTRTPGVLTLSEARK